MIWVFILLSIILILNGMPLFAGLGLLGVILTYFLSGQDVLVNLFIDPLGRLTQNDMLLPIPFFTLMGYIIARSGAPERFVKLFQYLIQTIFGKASFTLGVMAIVVSAFFTPLTGASGVTIVALGGILMPVLSKVKYPQNLRLGIITSSGSLGLLFFPSIPVIIYGIVSNNKVSITDLFRAGILPGILLILLPSLYVLYKSRNIKVDSTEILFSTVKNSLNKSLLEILIIPILYFLFMSGKITVSEIGLIALLYFFLLEVIIFKEINRKSLSDITLESMSVTGGILIIIFFATSFTSFMIDFQVPQKLFIWIQQYIQSKWTFLIFLNLFLLIVGSLMDIFSAIIVVAPLVIPIAELYGINMIHLGILFLTNLEIGYITPPVGMNLFLSSFRFKIPMVDIYKAILPFLLIMIIAQLMITYIPALSLWLVR
ncbi:MAG: TRAP transporter large permease subunit [Spirochaetia bacterium]|nr:TRAP transporter large permease subunit [Spirochaetia bacterium]